MDISEGDILFEQFFEDIEVFGLVFVKLVQVLFICFDLVVLCYLLVLQCMQDDVGEVVVIEIEGVVVQELGVLVGVLFCCFDFILIVVGLLVQVYVVELFDGMLVVVKVQWFGIEVCVVLDMELLIVVVCFVEGYVDMVWWLGVCDWVVVFYEVLNEELDFVVEVENLEVLVEVFDLYFGLVVLLLYCGFCMWWVLMMDLICGSKVEVGVIDMECGEVFGSLLLCVYFDQVFVCGCVYVDLYLGNVLLDEDGYLVVIDVGMVIYLLCLLCFVLLWIMLYVIQGDGDMVVDLCEMMGWCLFEYDCQSYCCVVCNLVGCYVVWCVDGVFVEGILLFDFIVCGVQCGL